jgi:cytochrome c oxidase subunit 2
MRFRVIADTPEEFEAWKASQLADAPLPTTPEETEGARLFVNKGCIACHTISGVVELPDPIGPNLTHLGSRITMAAGIMDMNADNLTEWLNDPDEVKPGNIMSKDAPVFNGDAPALSVEEIDGLVAYLQSLK